LKKKKTGENGRGGTVKHKPEFDIMGWASGKNDETEGPNTGGQE